MTEPTAPLVELTEAERELAWSRRLVLAPTVEDGVPLTRSASHARVPFSTARRWLARYQRRAGGAGPVSRSDRGHRRTHPELVLALGLTPAPGPPPYRRADGPIPAWAGRRRPSDIGTMAGPASDCAAVLSSDVGEEVASFDCKDADVVIKGEPVTIKKWHGAIVEMAEPKGKTSYGVGTGGSSRTTAASGFVLLGGLLALAYLMSLAFVIAIVLLRHRTPRPAPVSDDGAWWWNGRQWLSTQSIPAPARRSEAIPVLVALLVAASLLGTGSALAGELAAARGAGPPNLPCPADNQPAGACYQIVAGKVTTVSEKQPCSAALDSSGGPTRIPVACSDTYLFTVGRYETTRYWNGSLYWVSQGSDPTVIGAGVTPGFLFLVMIPSGLALIGAMILLAVRRSRRSFLSPERRVS